MTNNNKGNSPDATTEYIMSDSANISINAEIYNKVFQKEHSEKKTDWKRSIIALQNIESKDSVDTAIKISEKMDPKEIVMLSVDETKNSHNSYIYIY